MAKKVVKRAEPKSGSVAVDYPESTDPVEAYCMKCKAKVEAVEVKSVVISGKNAIQGKCSVCGTKVFKFVKKGGAKEVAAKKVKPNKKKVKPNKKANSKPNGLSAKASKAYKALEKSGLLQDCWVGVTDGGAAVWWEGSSAKGWTLCMDPIQNEDEASFKKLVVKSL